MLKIKNKKLKNNFLFKICSILVIILKCDLNFFKKVNVIMFKNRYKIIRVSFLKFFGALSAYLFLLQVSIASSMDQSGLPWESPLQKLMQSISGPVAKILGVIVIVLAGLGLAFGEVGSGVKRLLQVVLGLAIAFSAASIISGLYFGGSSGLVF